MTDIAKTMFGFAEGAHIDVRGTVTASGIAPVYMIVDSFPAQISPFIVFVGVNHDDSPHQLEGSVRLTVTGPDDTVLFFQNAPFTSLAKKYPGLPGSVTMVSGLPLQVVKPGMHRARLEMLVGGEQVADCSATLQVLTREDLEAAERKPEQSPAQNY